MIRAGVLAAALLATGCVSFRYDRDIVELRPDDAVVNRLAVGDTTLSDALAALGAPTEVWEGPGGSVACTWGGLKSRGWNVDVSMPVTEAYSASVSYTDTHAKTRGWMLLFGADDRLELVREGNLTDLRRAYARRRPASVDDDEPPPPAEPGP